MDQYVSKPFKRFLANSKNNKFSFNSVSYSADTEEATINMTKIKSIIKVESSPAKKTNVYFSDSVETVASEEENNTESRTFDFNNETVNLNNNIKLVKVKIIQGSLKKVSPMFNLTEVDASDDSFVSNMSPEPSTVCVDAQIHNQNCIESEDSNESNTETIEKNECSSDENINSILNLKFVPKRVYNSKMWRTLPKLGTRAILNSAEQKKDSEIISELVRSRFVVNLFESRNKILNDCDKSYTPRKFRNTLERSCNINSSKETMPENIFNSDNVNFIQSTLKPSKIRTSPTRNLPSSNHSSGSNIYEDIQQLSISNCYNTSEEEINKNPVTSDYATGSSTPEKIECDSVLSSVSSYNPEEFLKRALGEEVNDLEKVDKPEIELGSVSTANASLLVSKLHTLRSNVFQSVSRNFQHVSETFRVAEQTPKKKEEYRYSDLSSLFSDNEKVTTLLRKAAVQYETLKQITKALTVCENMKEFCESLEQVEGERLLLVATYKRQAILDEIHRLEKTPEESSRAVETGTVVVSGIWLSVKTAPAETQRNRDISFTRWYAIVFSYGSQVFATKVATSSGDDVVKFAEKVVFENLPTEFIIKAEVFCLLQRKTGRNYSHESKYHINKISKQKQAAHCPKPKRLRKKKNSQILTRYNLDIIRTSSFKYCGSFTLTVTDIGNTGPRYLRGQIPFCSLLTGQINAHIESSVRIPVKLNGFITIGCEIGGCTSWNRRWCALEDNLLKFWSSPNEDTTPIKEIDLKQCANATVQVVDRSLCARPRTLLLEIAKPQPSNNVHPVTIDSTFILERFYLSMDNAQDLEDWQKELDYVVQILRVWNTGFF